MGGGVRREARNNRESRRNRCEVRTYTGLRELGMKGILLTLILAGPRPVERTDVRTTRGEGRQWEQRHQQQPLQR